MRLFCSHCGKSVSNAVPDSTIIRASLECPECLSIRYSLTAADVRRLLFCVGVTFARHAILPIFAADLCAKLEKLKEFIGDEEEDDDGGGGKGNGTPPADAA